MTWIGFVLTTSRKNSSREMHFHAFPYISIHFPCISPLSPELLVGLDPPWRNHVDSQNSLSPSGSFTEVSVSRDLTQKNASQIISYNSGIENVGTMLLDVLTKDVISKPIWNASKVPLAVFLAPGLHYGSTAD